MEPVDPMESAPPRAHAWTRLDVGLLVAVVAASTLARVLLRTRGVFSVDSALLALGVRSFDFASYHPHPPYYPLTVAAGKLLAPLLGPVAALTWLALASSAVMAVGVFVVARALAGRWAGAWAAALAGLSPLAMGNAVVPLSYASEGAASVLVAALAINAEQRPTRWSWIAVAAATSLAVGLRPSAALAVGPLLLWAGRSTWRGLAWMTGAGLVATAAWLGAAVGAGGTWAQFRSGNAYQGRLFVLSNPVWEGGWQAVRNNVAWILHHLRVEAPLLVALAVLCAVTFVAPRRHPPAHRGLLATWLVPSLAFYALVYAGWPVFPSGYLLGLVPALFVAAAVALRRLVDLARDPLLDGPLRKASVGAVALLAVVPVSWAGHWDEELALRDEVEAWNRSWAGLESALPPNRTAVLASYAGSWMLLEHPDYLIWIVETVVDDDGNVRLQVEQWQGGRVDKPFFVNVRDGPDDPGHPVPEWVQEIVVLSGHPMEGDVPPMVKVAAARHIPLAGGAVAPVLDARGLDEVEMVIAGLGDVEPFTLDVVWPPGWG